MTDILFVLDSKLKLWTAWRTSANFETGMGCDGNNSHNFVLRVMDTMYREDS